MSRSAIRDRVLAIVNTPGVTVEDEDLILQAIVWYATENVDFIDAYNAAWLLTNGMQTAHTFVATHFSRFEGINVKAPGEET